MPPTDDILMTLVIFVPVFFALVIPFIPKGKDDAVRWWTLFGTALTLAISVWMFVYFLRMHEEHSSSPAATSLSSRVADALQAGKDYNKSNDWVARYWWIPQFNIEYYLGVDGISMALLLMTTALTFLAMIASWNIEKHVKGYCILFLLLLTGMVGTFLALDFFLFYIFWEVMLLPMYFLIGVWGGPRREYAAIKFFLYTLLGSVFILIALLGFYFTDIQDFVHPDRVQSRANATAPYNSFDIIALQSAGKAAALNIDNKTQDIEVYVQDSATSKVELKKVKDLPAAKQAEVKKRLDGQLFFSSPWFQWTMFLLLFVGFAIKVPVFPFHTWLPDAHVEAPTPISMILAGVLLKMGGYGILRIAYPICPWAAHELAWYVALFGVINIVYGAFAAMAQTDFKKLVAYSSVSHMGYVILGIAVWSAANQGDYWKWGMNGAMYQMIGHGITSAGMFFLVGVIYDRAHHRNLDNFRGLSEPMPLYSGIAAIIFFAAMGLPGMCGFVGEFMVVLAAWNYDKLFAILAALSVVLTAGYILWTVQRVFLGQNPAYKGYEDINWRELACVIPLVVLAVLLGVYPNCLLSWMEPSVTGLVNALLAARTGP